MNRPPKRIVAVLAFLLTVAFVPCGWASSEVLGVAYVPVQDPQTGEPVVMAVPFMNSEPGAVERALDFIGKPLHLTAVGPVLTNRTDDVNLVSLQGIKLKAGRIADGTALEVKVLLPDSDSASDKDRAPLIRALSECVRRTAHHYGVSDCRVSVPGVAGAVLDRREPPASSDQPK